MVPSARKTCPLPPRVLAWLTPRTMLALVAAGMASMSLFSFVLQWGFHILPCPMCWWQRYIHYTIFAVSLVGVVRPNLYRYVVVGVALLALTGLSIAIWQFSAQHGWLPFPETCAVKAFDASNPDSLLSAMQAVSTVIPCSQDTFRLLGLSLAGWNIIAMSATLVWLTGVVCVAHRAERLAK